MSLPGEVAFAWLLLAAIVYVEWLLGGSLRQLGFEKVFVNKGSEGGGQVSSSVIRVILEVPKLSAGQLARIVGRRENVPNNYKAGSEVESRPRGGT